MRATYKDPKELAKALKDQIDLYFEEIMSEEKLEVRVKRIVTTNESRFYKNGKVQSKIAEILGQDRLEVIEKIMNA